MKKLYRKSQIKDVLGRRLRSLDLCRLGLPYGGFSGLFFPKDVDRIDMMLDLIVRHPELHIASQMPGDEGHLVNRYEQGAKYYLVYHGNNDPDIEFTQECSDDDYSAEEIERIQRIFEDFRNSQWSPMQVAGVNWALDHALKKHGNKSGNE